MVGIPKCDFAHIIFFNLKGNLMEPKVDAGFDRGVDFKDMKKKLIDEYHRTIQELEDLYGGDRYYDSKRRKLIHRIIYILICMIQLFNGARISEACLATSQFLIRGNPDEKIIVKIAKSESIKYNKEGEQYKTKARYRYLIFPKKWIEFPTNLQDTLETYIAHIKTEALKKRVLDYLLKYHKCNTHSLRYAYINYMLYTEKKEPSLVAKHVGHSSMAQLVRYTQKKESDKLFELDI